jgi:MinD-like ATPase involved in chromosome partitioning or flagellar assembly
MQALRVGVAGVRAGQGATGYALALAWSSARDRPTVIVDVDGAGGTVADLLAIEDRRCLQNVFSPHGVSGGDLGRQAITVAGRPQLRVIPGFRDPGPSGADVAALLLPALGALKEDVAVIDLGTPFAYPGLVRRDQAAQAVAAACHSVLIVTRVEDDLLADAIRTLSTVRVPRARLVLVRPPHRRGMKEARALLQEKLPEYPVAGEWEWNPEKWVHSRAQRAPVTRDGLAEELGLVGGGVITNARSRRWMHVFRKADSDA